MPFLYYSVMRNLPSSECGVYGLGRFGSFWASLLAQRGSIKGYSRSSERETPPGVERVNEDSLFACDTVFLCTSISSLEEVTSKLADKCKPGTLIIETCSVKVYPRTILQEKLPRNLHYLCTHPMFGPDSGQGGVENLPFVVCEGRLPEKRKEAWINLFQSLGLRIIPMTADSHDREAAYTQGITHFIGRVLKDLKLKKSTISTLGFQKLIEIIEQTCNDPWQLFLDLQHFNPYTLSMRKELSNSLTKILTKLESNLDTQKMERYHINKME